MILSICIPSYNRPETLLRLLESIDVGNRSDIEVVICEDNSPKRHQIRILINKFIVRSNLKIVYIENPINLGYDKNLRELIKYAQGDFIMYMGDDDYFYPGALDGYINYLRANFNTGYILRTWVLLHKDGWMEPFDYFDESRTFEPGEKTFILLYRKSTFISGFTFKRDYANPFLINKFDGTLLYQLYLLAELTLKYQSAFYAPPLVIQKKIKDDIPHFGSSAIEKNKYTPGEITVENSINFLQGYTVISTYIDKKYNHETCDSIVADMSKYSYSYLVLHRDKGVFEFTRFYSLLISKVKLGRTVYVHIYYLALLIAGVRFCNLLIHSIKKVIGKTPAG